MDITFSAQDIFTGKYDGIVLFTYEERSSVDAKVTHRYGKNLLTARERKEFSGKHKEIFLELQPEQPRFVVVAGLGKREEITPTRLREAAGAAALRLRDLGARHIALEAPGEMDAQDVGQAITEGAGLATYQFTRYKTQKLDELKRVAAITIVSDRTGLGVRQGVDIGRIIVESCAMVRDLQNTPSQDLTPPMLANEAVQLARREKLACTVLDRKQLEKGGYNGILSVGRGSVNEPRLVTLTYAPKGAKKSIAIVGKGITFDTGGISLKPGEKMADMKFDMSGAAVVLGVMRNVARLKLPVTVYGVMAIAENMPDGGAYKPGDVVRTKSGKTIEVDNTDAEGRVVLSDALHHASLLKPDMIVDLATLTGAVIIALGDVAAGVLGNDQAVIDRVKAAAEKSGEKVWQLPLWEEYERDIESNIADVRNMGLPRCAGTIAGAVFLKQFVNGVPWAHLDIAGVSWADLRDNYFTQRGKGGTAYGVRLMTDLVRSL